MTRQRPSGEAMSREGKGTAAAGEVGNSRPIRWEDAQERLTKGGWFWLSTVRPDGAPHAMPVLAVWSESALYVSSKGTARKARNLAADGRCVITTDTGDLHLIVEGEARRVRDEATLGCIQGNLRLAHRGDERQARRRVRCSHIRRPAVQRLRDHADESVWFSHGWRVLHADELEVRSLTAESQRWDKV